MPLNSPLASRLVCAAWGKGTRASATSISLCVLMGPASLPIFHFHLNPFHLHYFRAPFIFLLPIGLCFNSPAFFCWPGTILISYLLFCISTPPPQPKTNATMCIMHFHNSTNTSITCYFHHHHHHRHDHHNTGCNTTNNSHSITV